MNEFKQLSRKIRFIFIGLIVIAAGSLIAASVMGMKLKAAVDPAASTQAQIDQVVGEVGRVLILPTGETPTLATVADPSKLKDQPFFANAKAGDIVLVYSNSKKAVLWRPSDKKVVEVSALNVAPPAAQ